MTQDKQHEHVHDYVIVYFEVLDVMTEWIHHFEQRYGTVVAATFGTILLNGANGERVELPDDL